MTGFIIGLLMVNGSVTATAIRLRLRVQTDRMASRGADGKDGITPQLKIENDYWYISYDNGKSWTKLGKAKGEDGENGSDGADGLPGADAADGKDGDAFFQKVDTSNSDYVVFVLADGTEVKVPIWAAFESLQKRVNELNTTVEALSELVNKIGSGDYITKIEAYMENGVQVGYQLYFHKSAPIVLYNNINPVITVMKDDATGLYYWAMDGMWLKDSDGNRIPAQTEDYVIPQIKAATGFWMISTDGGNTWTRLCEVTGDSLKVVDGITITQNDNLVYFTLAGGTVLTIPENDGWLEYERIVFADEQVKNICLANWDTDGDGELTYFEAKVVESLGDKFKGNKMITSFEKLPYFTGLSSINKSAFEGCNLLEKVVLPKNIKSIVENAFYGCAKLKEIAVPEGVLSIGNYAFKGCSLLQKAVLPEEITSLGTGAFENCVALTTINLPNTITTIAFGAFPKCKNLKDIVFGKSLLMIGSSAFNDLDVHIPALIVFRTDFWPFSLPLKVARPSTFQTAQKRPESNVQNRSVPGRSAG